MWTSRATVSYKTDRQSRMHQDHVWSNMSSPMHESRLSMRWLETTKEWRTVKLPNKRGWVKGQCPQSLHMMKWRIFLRRTFFRNQNEEFYARATDLLLTWWDKCFNKYVDFFRVEMNTYFYILCPLFIWKILILIQNADT